MLSFKQRAAGLRRSMVSVTATLVPLGACELGGPKQPTMNPPPCAATGSCTPELTGECPEVAAEADGSCELEGLLCSYGGCSDLEAGAAAVPAWPMTAECQDGMWLQKPLDCGRRDGGPGLPDGGPGLPDAARFEDCPDAGGAVVNGAPCNVEPAQSCNYYWCGSLPSVSGHCVEGRWVVTETSCNPPFPTDECPSELPRSGETCSVAGDQTCEYKVACGDQVDHGAHCNGLSWDVTEHPCELTPEELCPAAKPTRNEPCAVPTTLVCDYPAPCSLLLITDHARCVEGRWSLIEAQCNPPPPP